MIAATYTALKSQIETAVGLAGKVYDSARLTPEDELIRDLYLILFPTAPFDPTSGRYLAVADWVNVTATFEYDIRFCATTAAGVLALMDRAAGVVQGKTLTVAGRVCAPMSFAASSRVVPDRSVKPPLFYGDATVEFISRPGT